jgi:hypothetical protein
MMLPVYFLGISPWILFNCLTARIFMLYFFFYDFNSLNSCEQDSTGSRTIPYVIKWQSMLGSSTSFLQYLVNLPYWPQRSLIFD